MIKEELLNYINQGYSISEICAATNKGNGTIVYWMKKHHLKTHHKQRDCSKEALWRKRDVPRKFSPSRAQRHIRSQERNDRFKQMNWNTVQSIYDAGFNYKETSKKSNISMSVLRRGVAKGYLKPRSISEALKVKHRKSPRPPPSEETRSKISKARKTFMANNPNWHWRSLDRFKSVPCERFKQFLKDAGLFFEEEHQPLYHKGRFYRIDISFPSIKLGIEINGSQHYSHGETLNEYHKNRHDLIVAEGWELIEIHYAKSFNSHFREQIVEYVKRRLSSTSSQTALQAATTYPNK